MKTGYWWLGGALTTFALVAYAQDATGTWMGERAGRGGGEPQKITLMLKADGTGMMKTGDQEDKLSDVKIDGKKVSFKRSFAGRGGQGGGMTLSYAGEVDGDTLTLNMTFEGGPGGGGGGGGGGRAGGGGFQIPPLVLKRE